MEPNILAVTAINISATLKPIKLDLRPLTLNVLLFPSSSIDAEDSLSIATARATNITANAAIAPTELHNCPASNCASKYTAPANMAKLIAKSFIAAAFILNACAFKTLEKLLTTFAVLFKIFFIESADFLRTSPTPESKSPTPPNGAVKLLIVSVIFLVISNKPPAATTVNALLKSKFFIHSITLEPKLEMAVHTLDVPSFIPFTNPSIVYLPTSYISVDGE